jgi:surface protein
MFYGAVAAEPVTTTNGNIWNTSNVTDMAYMFESATKANPDTSGWDVSSVTNMRAMFKNAVSANPDTSQWNVSSVTNMRAMFRGAVSANPVTTGWDVSSVTNMRTMFNDATSANPDVSEWDTSSVTDMAYMFENAVKANPDVEKWDVRQVTTMRGMFHGASAFDRNLGDWNVTNVSDFTYFLSNASLSVYHYDALLKGWSKLTLVQDLHFDAGDSHYCDAEAARDSMIVDDGWTINDAGKSCPGPCEAVSRPLKAYHWTLVSFPCDTGSNGIEDLLGASLGAYGDDADWVMYEQTGSDAYKGPQTQKRMLSSTDRVEPGKGYWIIVASDKTMRIDTNLSGLAFTNETNASDLGIDDPDFSTVYRKQLPDSDTNDAKKFMAGNPFPTPFHLDNLYISHADANAHYAPMSESNDTAQNPNAPYIEGRVYTFDAQSTSANDYIAVSPDTPGFPHTVDAMSGFFFILKSGESGTNYAAFPKE